MFSEDGIMLKSTHTKRYEINKTLSTRFLHNKSLIDVFFFSTERFNRFVFFSIISSVFIINFLKICCFGIIHFLEISCYHFLEIIQTHLRKEKIPSETNTLDIYFQRNMNSFKQPQHHSIISYNSASYKFLKVQKEYRIRKQHIINHPKSEKKKIKSEKFSLFHPFV